MYANNTYIRRWFQNTYKYLFPSMNYEGFSLEVEIILKTDEKLG